MFGVVAFSTFAIALAICNFTGINIHFSVSTSQMSNVDFFVDSLSAWFLIIVGGLFLIGSFYGKSYLAHYKTTTPQETLHWIVFPFTLAGIIILLTTSNLIFFLIGWELMAICSFFAVIFEYDRPEVIRAGTNYFIQSHVAVLLLTAAFGIAIAHTGDTSFAGLQKFFATASVRWQVIVMSMLIFGFGFKAGIVPFHSWLPHAHPAAPSHISALMSGVIVKVGIYGIFRFGAMLTPNAALPIGIMLLIMGIVSSLFGIINAAVGRDFKRVLAYCTIENIGIICLGLGLGFLGLALSADNIMYLGFAGALFHTLNHALFKALLFFAAGNVYTSVHTRNMELLGGLGKSMPHTARLFLFGSVGIGGLPPLPGFISEIFIYCGLLAGMQLASLPIASLMALTGIALALVGGASIVTFTKTHSVIFLGSPRTKLPHSPSEVSRSMLLPAYIIAALIIVVFLFAQPISHFLLSVVSNVVKCGSFDASYLHTVSLLQVAMIAFALLIVVVHLVYRHFASRLPLSESTTWGCGYLAPIRSIQYTGKSFVGSLSRMCRAFLPHSVRFMPIDSQDVFPDQRRHLSTEADFVDQNIITPSTSTLINTLHRFEFIENGDLQRYVIYGLAYILLLVSVTLFFF